jgi:hypothetical protein
VSQPTELRLYEQIVLLALDRENGEFDPYFRDYAVTGAILSELFLLGRLDFDEHRKPKVLVRSVQRVGDPLLDRSLRKMHEADRPHSIDEWITKLSSSGLRHDVAKQLVSHRIVRPDTSKVLGVFNRKVYLEADPLPEAAIRERLEQAIFTDDPVDIRTILLLSLVKDIHILRKLFAKEELKERKARIKALRSKSAVDSSTAHATGETGEAKAALKAILATKDALSGD